MPRLRKYEARALRKIREGAQLFWFAPNTVNMLLENGLIDARTEDIPTDDHKGGGATVTEKGKRALASYDAARAKAKARRHVARCGVPKWLQDMMDEPLK